MLPLSVILSIPTGVIGAFLGIRTVGLDNNIFVQVGLIMLVGLLAKNAILIVEFAVQRRKEGMSIMDSAITGARSRLRPIVMTSLAFIVGMIPLMISSGGMAAGNISISVKCSNGNAKRSSAWRICNTCTIYTIPVSAGKSIRKKTYRSNRKKRIVMNKKYNHKLAGSNCNWRIGKLLFCGSEIYTPGAEHAGTI